MGKVAKKQSEVSFERLDCKYCSKSKALKHARRAYNRALRAHNRNVCREALAA